MKDARMRVLRTGRNIGAVMGGIVFLVFGTVPAFYFGSFGTLSLINHLAGPVDPGMLVRMLLVGGIVMGWVCTAFVSIVVGSVLGTALAWASDAVGSASPTTPAKATAVK